MNTAFISIGSNIGDRSHHLREAVRLLHALDNVVVMSVSSIYETAPVGYTDQADFLNLVIHIETRLDPYELLAACQVIELGLGRTRDVRWGPRTVDLDILLYNNETIDTKSLTVPHPRMRERAFVLIPLIELAPKITHPATGKLFAKESALEDVGVLLWEKSNGVEGFIQQI